MSDIPKYITEPRRGDFKGNPMLYLPTGENGYRWGFGLTKATFLLDEQTALEEAADLCEELTIHVGGKYNQEWLLKADQVKAAVLYRSDIQKFVDEIVKDRQYRKGDFKTVPSSYGRDFH